MQYVSFSYISFIIQIINGKNYLYDIDEIITDKEQIIKI